MIEKTRNLLFKYFKKESFIGKLIDKLFTKEMIAYIFFGTLTTVFNWIAFAAIQKFFGFVGWDGVLNQIIPADTALYTLFSHNGSDYLDANCIAWVVGVIFAFVANKLWVFESKSWKPSVAFKEFTGFVGARVFSFIVETLLMFVFVTLLSQNENFAKILCAVVTIILNYIFSKFLVFKKKG